MLARLFEPMLKRRPTTLALIELVRIERPVGTAMYAMLGAYLGTSIEGVCSVAACTAALIVGLVTAFGFAINDCRDQKVDAIGRPERPIPAGRITARTAEYFAWSLAAAALTISATLGREAVLFTLCAIIMSAAYSYRLKGRVLVGNITIGVLVAAVLAFGAMVAGEVNQAVLVAAMMTAPYIVAQEVLFNVEDHDDDARAGLGTTATALGVEPAITLSRVILLGFMAAAVAPWAAGLASDSYLLAAVVCLLAPSATLWHMLRRPVSQTRVRQAAKLSRLVWITSFIPLAFLK